MRSEGKSQCVLAQKSSQPQARGMGAAKQALMWSSNIAVSDAVDRIPARGDSKMELFSAPGSTNITKCGKRLGSQEISGLRTKVATSFSTC
jgi:hypothetical protein